MNKAVAVIVMDAFAALGISAALLQGSRAPLPEYYRTIDANRKAASSRDMPWKWAVTFTHSHYFGDEAGEVRLCIMAEKEVVLNQTTFFPSIRINLQDGVRQVYFGSSMTLRHEENAEIWTTFSDSAEDERWVLEPAPTYRVMKIVEGDAFLARLSSSQWVKIRFQPMRSDRPLETQYSLQPMAVALAKMERLSHESAEASGKYRQ